MEADTNNQPTLDNHKNLYKLPGQEDQVTSDLHVFKELVNIVNMLVIKVY